MNCWRCGLLGRQTEAVGGAHWAGRFCAVCLPLRESALFRFDGPAGIGAWLESPKLGRISLTGHGIAEMRELAQIPSCYLERLEYIGPVALQKLQAALVAWRRTQPVNIKGYDDEWSTGG